MKTFSFESIGTKWQIDINSNISNNKLENLKENVFSFLNDFKKTYSRFDKESLVSEIAKRGGNYQMPESSKEIFSLYEKLYALTNGKFTPLIGDTLNSLGYDADYSFEPKNVVKPPHWEKVIEFDYPILKTKKGVTLDFGACGKGYTIDRIADILKKNSVNSFVIDAGGDIRVSSFNSKIGLENPMNLKQVIGTVTINNRSICASSQNRRRWKNYSHIINPENVNEQNNVLATWVIAEKAFLSDAIATALFLEKPEKLGKEFDFEFLLLDSQMRVVHSKDFNAEIYYN